MLKLAVLNQPAFQKTNKEWCWDRKVHPMSEEPVLAVIVHPDNAFADELVALASAPVAKTKGFDGLDLLTFLLPLVASAIPSIVKVVTKSIEARQYILVKHKGVEIRGISETKLLLVLEKLAKQASADKAAKKE